MRKIPFAGIELKSQRVRGLRGTSELPGRPARYTVSIFTGVYRTLVHKIRLHGRRGKGMAESFLREKLRHAPQKEGG